jgi:hypothetical protein
VGGRNCVIAAVKYLTGVPVNHFVEVKLLGFKAIVEALGGVTICTTHAISDPVRTTPTGSIGSGLVTDPLKLYDVLAKVAQSLTVDPGLAGDSLQQLLLGLGSLKPSAIRFYTVPNVGRGDGATVSWVQSGAKPMWSAMIHDTPYPAAAPKPTSSSTSSSRPAPTPSSSPPGSDGSTAADSSCIS